MKLRKLLLDNSLTRPGLRNESRYLMDKPEAIVIHWTGNTDIGADAMANRNYFNKITDKSKIASAHYIVDGSGVIQCIPDNEVAFHVGDKPRSWHDLTFRNSFLEGKKYNNPNYYTLGVEMCVNIDNDWVKTYNNTLELVRELLKRHDLGIMDIHRHYDFTGKDCPKMFLPFDLKEPGLSEWNWEMFLYDVGRKPEVKEIIKEVIKVVPEQLTAMQHLSMFFKKMFK